MDKPILHKDQFNEIIIVLTTEADCSLAEILAKKILENRLAACISLQNIRSFYWWGNKLEDSKEVQLYIKTSNCLRKELFLLIEDFHSYENPEIISWPVSASENYEQWIHRVVRLD